MLVPDGRVVRQRRRLQVRSRVQLPPLSANSVSVSRPASRAASPPPRFARRTFASNASGLAVERPAPLGAGRVVPARHTT